LFKSYALAKYVCVCVRLLITTTTKRYSTSCSLHRY